MEILIKIMYWLKRFLYFKNNYNWTGTINNNKKYKYKWYRRGNISGVESFNYIYDYIKPQEVPQEWLKINDPKEMNKKLYNKRKYVKDKELYSLREHWESPREFIDKNYSGDCDAISFFYASWAVAKKFKIRIILGNYGKKGTKFKYDYNHLTILLFKNKKIYYVDPTNYHFVEAKYFSKFIPFVSFDENNIYLHKK
jgi:hypothetical protein